MIATSSPSVSPAAVQADPVLEYLSFQLGSVEYGIDILKVQEIRGYEAPTRIAGTPPHIRGVLNLRGVIVPVVDLRLRMGLADAGFDRLTVTIVLHLDQGLVGAVVDAVSDVTLLDAAQIRPAPQFDNTVDADYITGIGTLGEGGRQRMLVLLDIEQLMANAVAAVGGQALQ
jgi:purine-binding chemotaxis protein CheW